MALPLAAGAGTIVPEIENMAQSASSPALLQELASAGEQLARIKGALKLPAAPLQLIPLPTHAPHVFKPTAKEAPPSSVSVTSEDIYQLPAVSGITARSSPSDYQIPTVQVPKVVIEYPVPGSKETHEMAVVGHNMLLVSQQQNSILVKIMLSPTTGRPISCARFLLGDFWAGLHGLFPSQVYDNEVWASLQFKSLIIRIKPGLTLDSTPRITQVITLPASVNGPHCVCECGPDLWIGCKDSSHVVRVKYTNPTSNFSVYPCSGRPIFMARHPTSHDFYASLDSSSKIWHLVVSKDKAEEIDIPTKYGSTPVGLVPGTDGNVWFTLVGGKSGGMGTFARILPSGEFQWFFLTSPIAADAGLFVSELSTSCLAHITGAAAFNVEDVAGETTDLYSHFGLGQTMPSYTYELELPKNHRVPTRNAPCPLPAGKRSNEELDKTEPATSDNIRSGATKRARAQ